MAVVQTGARGSRSEQARRTRQRIVAAATTLFLRDGFPSTTVVAIAQEAGVAVQTLYLAFGNKTAILHACFGIALAGDDEDVRLMERDLVRDVLSDDDGPRALRRFLAGTSRVIERAGPLYAVMQAAGGDPEVAALLRDNQRARNEGFATIVAALATKAGFSADLTIDDATGIVFALQSEESWLLFVQQHGWTTSRWADWVRTTLEAQFFPGAGD